MIHDTIGIAEEVTYGTILAPAKFHEFVDESLAANEEDVQSAAMPGGRRLLHHQRWAQGKASAGGDLGLEYVQKGMEYLWKHMLGNQAAIVVSGYSGALKSTLGDLAGKSLTVQKGLRDNTGTVLPFTYAGCKVASWEFGCDLDGFASLKLTLDAQKEDTATAYTTPAYTANQLPLPWTWGSVTINGVQVPVKSVKFRGDNALKLDRFLLQNANARYKKEPLPAGRPKVEGEVTLELSGTTEYLRVKTGTVAPIVATWAARGTGVGTYEASAGKPYTTIVTASACRFTAGTPVSGGEDLTEVTLPFTVLDDGGADGGFSVQHLI